MYAIIHKYTLFVKSFFQPARFFSAFAPLRPVLQNRAPLPKGETGGATETPPPTAKIVPFIQQGRPSRSPAHLAPLKGELSWPLPPKAMTEGFPLSWRAPACALIRKPAAGHPAAGSFFRSAHRDGELPGLRADTVGDRDAAGVGFDLRDALARELLDPLIEGAH